MVLTQSIFSLDYNFFEPKATIGGYGELHYNNEKIGNNPSKAIWDFHRFVLFFGYSWSEKWSFKSEVELEHNFVKNGQGELELEQAYVNYHHSDLSGFNAGIIVISFGSLWLMRFVNPNFVYLMAVSSSIIYLSYFIMLTLIVYEIIYKKS